MSDRRKGSAKLAEDPRRPSSKLDEGSRSASGREPDDISTKLLALADELERLMRQGQWNRRRSSVVSEPGIVTIGVGAIAWLPPVIDQLTNSPGNLRELARFSLDPPEPAAGWATAMDVFGAQLGVPPAWLRRAELLPGAVDTPPVPALFVVGLLLAAGCAAYRRGHRTAGRLVAIVLAAALGAFVATARITGPVFDYLIRFWWVVGVWAWAAMAWHTWLLVADRVDHRRRIIAGGVASAAAVTLSVMLTVRSLPPHLPSEQASDVVDHLADAVMNNSIRVSSTWCAGRTDAPGAESAWASWSSYTIEASTSSCPPSGA